MDTIDYTTRAQQQLDAMSSESKDAIILGLLATLYPGGDPDAAVSGADLLDECVRLTAEFHPGTAFGGALSQAQLERVRSWMRRMVTEYDDGSDDPLAGRVNKTKLAEDCASVMDLCAGDGDGTIPAGVWEIADEVADAYEAEMSADEDEDEEAAL